jgi:hypothetical protein
MWNIKSLLEVSEFITLWAYEVMSLFRNESIDYLKCINYEAARKKKRIWRIFLLIYEGNV